MNGCGGGTDAATGIEPEELARARCYLLFAGLLHRPPDAEFLASIGILDGGPETPLLTALGDLGRCARTMSADAVRQEYSDLFHGLGGTTINPYESYYRTGFMYEKPLAELRRTFDRLGIQGTRSTGDPEDHAAAIFEAMAGLITGAYGPPARPSVQKDFFAKHIQPWIPDLFGDLAATADAKLYSAVGVAGQAFLQTEARAFEQIAGHDPAGG